jgi:hypothetical protein
MSTLPLVEQADSKQVRRIKKGSLKIKRDIRFMVPYFDFACR